MVNTVSAHEAPLPLCTASAAVRPPSLMLATIMTTPRGTHAAAAVVDNEQAAARHGHAAAVMTLTAPSDDDADRGAEDVNRDGEGDAGGSGGCGVDGGGEVNADGEEETDGNGAS